MDFNSEFKIKRAAKALISGNLVAFPTETVYGLGADALNKTSVLRLYELKKRPKDHPIIVHLANLSNIEFWVSDIPSFFNALTSKFVPGPITFILKKRSSLDVSYLTGNQNKIGLRIPSHAIAQLLLREFELLNGKGIAAPSANPFGSVSNTNANRVRIDFEADFRTGDLILDGGSSDIGIESTILDCSGDIPTILRPGYISKKEIENCLKMQIGTVEDYRRPTSQTRASGMLSKHYAPKAKVVFFGNPNAGDGYIGLKSNPVPKGVVILSLPKDSEEFAENLYESFHLADELGLKRIFVAIPETGKLVDAIKDRVTRAAGGISL